MLDIDTLLSAIRAEFPRIGSDASGRPRVFFDSAAGSLVSRRAAAAEAACRIDFSANLGLPAWESGRAGEAIVQGRAAIRDFLNAQSGDSIVSGESATDMLFHLSYAISKQTKGDENVVVTGYDHYANISPWAELQTRGAIKEVRFARFRPDDGQLDLEHLAGLVDGKTKVVALAGISNAIGSKSPVGEVCKIASEVGAYSVVDAVHMVPHTPIDVQQLGCDFLVFSAYKLFSSRGSFMYGRNEALSNLSPYKDKPTPNVPPAKWEGGARDPALFASMTGVMDYLEWLGGIVEDTVSGELGTYEGRVRKLKAALKWADNYETTLSRAMLEGVGDAPGLNDISKVIVYGSRDPSKVSDRAPTFAFNVKGIAPAKVASKLWEEHAVVVRAQSFYSKAWDSYEEQEAVRASLVHYNTATEVQQLLRGLAAISKSA